MGGIVSGGTKGKATFMLSSPTVMVESRPVCRKSDLMIMNEINTVGLAGMNQEDVGPANEFSVEPLLIEIELKDDEGNPVADERFQIVHSGKVTYEGNLDANGCAKVESVHGSGFKVKFPDQQNVFKEEN